MTYKTTSIAGIYVKTYNVFYLVYAYAKNWMEIRATCRGFQLLMFSKASSNAFSGFVTVDVTALEACSSY
jgi:hypothetical protein